MPLFFWSLKVGVLPSVEPAFLHVSDPVCALTDYSYSNPTSGLSPSLVCSSSKRDPWNTLPPLFCHRRELPTSVRASEGALGAQLWPRTSAPPPPSKAGIWITEYPRHLKQWRRPRKRRSRTMKAIRLKYLHFKKTSYTKVKKKKNLENSENIPEKESIA